MMEGEKRERNWDRIERVWLNPETKKKPAEETMAEAA
jgi:hypothetical protein